MKFPPDDLRDIILRTEEQRRALLEPYFKQAEIQARLAENLITNRIDRSMVDRFADEMVGLWGQRAEGERASLC